MFIINSWECFTVLCVYVKNTSQYLEWKMIKYVFLLTRDVAKKASLPRPFIAFGSEFKMCALGMFSFFFFLERLSFCSSIVKWQNVNHVHKFFLAWLFSQLLSVELIFRGSKTWNSLQQRNHIFVFIYFFASFRNLIKF